MFNMEELDLLHKKNGEILDSTEWNTLVGVINYIIEFYNHYPTKLSEFENDIVGLFIGPKGDKGDKGEKGDKGDAGEQGLKGQDGTVTFDQLTNEQRESLRGPQGIQGKQGVLGIQGPAGNDGITPHIDSTTGNWFVGTTDTGVHAQGPAGQNGTAAGLIQADWNQTDNAQVSYIRNKPTIPVVPTNVSSFTNDAGYLTSHLSLTDYVLKSQTAGLLKNDGTVDTNAYLTAHLSLSGYAKLWSGTQAQYDLLTPESDTIYIITAAS